MLLKGDFLVSVIYVQADDSVRDTYEIAEYKNDGVQEYIIYFKNKSGLAGKLINARRYKKAQQIVFSKLQIPVDLCHVHVPYRSAFLALELKKKHSIPFVITEHWSGHLTGEFNKKNILDKLLYQSVLKKATAITCVSELLAKKFKENTGYAAAVIPNYIERVSSAGSLNHSEKTQLLSVSDMADGIKNISGLLEAFSSAIKENINLHLTLIGGGPDEEKIKNLLSRLQLESHVTFKGRLAHEAVLQEMLNCHFYISNSNFETFGMTLAEALSAGKPVISTRCGGPEEFLNEHNSILVQPKNIAQLTQAILKMASTYAAYDSEKLANDMKLKFGKEAVREKWIAFYNSVTNN